ncbi:MAG: IMPACT family protein [Bacteroidota bacterium]
MLFNNDYQTIQGPSIGEYREKGSLFIGYAFNVENEEALKNLIESVKKEHPKANHHCYAFVLGPGQQAFRFSDDREPSGTAGRPILAAIKSADLTNILIVVVRYFGGTLLGVQGLVRSYRAAAESALDSAKTIRIVITDKFKIIFPYSRTGDIEILLAKVQAKVVTRIMAENCDWELEVPREFSEDFFKTVKGSHPFSSDCSIQRI